MTSFNYWVHVPWNLVIMDTLLASIIKKKLMNVPINCNEESSMRIKKQRNQLREYIQYLDQYIHMYIPDLYHTIQGEH